MDEAILRAAKHVYEHLDDDVDTSTELELLQSNIEVSGELDCDGFVIWPENVASIWFDDSTMMEEIEDQDFVIDNAARLSYMREKLQGALEEPTDNDESFSIHKIEVDKDRSLFLCALVSIIGGGPMANWLRPSGSLTSLNEKITSGGFITDSDDINALSDSDLLSLWQ